VLTALHDGRPFDGTIVCSHLHWDHVMGLPFFAAGDHDDANVRLLLPEQPDVGPKEVLHRLMSPPLFPITPDELHGAWEFGAVADGEVRELEGFEVLARAVPHKGGPTLGFRVSDGTRSIAYLPDHAPHVLGPGPHGLGPYHEAAAALARDVDLLVHDAQYTRAELETRGDWGHAAAEYPARLAEAVGARRVLLFHHDPERTDADVRAIGVAVAALADVPVDVAVQGQVVQL
jgi:ribonuclease BN (tRNA processing enzyme)